MDVLYVTEKTPGPGSGGYGSSSAARRVETVLEDVLRCVDSALRVRAGSLTRSVTGH